jgi:hypothetical protein
MRGWCAGRSGPADGLIRLRAAGDVTGPSLHFDRVLLEATMNLDELAEAIRNVSSEKIVQDLSLLLVAWKGNDKTVRELEQEIERYLGNTWVQRNEDHATIHQLWSSFSKVAVTGIGGMSMNERLYWFGLFARFEACPDEAARRAVYRKLHASPA